MFEQQPHSLQNISAGALGLHRRCAFRLRSSLVGDSGKKFNDPSFRLSQAISQSLRAAHDHAHDLGVALDEAIEDMRLDVAPPELSVEEADVFAKTIELYVDAFNDDRRELHPMASQPLRRRVNTSPPFDLTSRVELLFLDGDRCALVRRIRFGSSYFRADELVADEPVADELANDIGDEEHDYEESNEERNSGVAIAATSPATFGDLALAVLLGASGGARARNDTVLRSETLWCSTSGEVTRSVVTGTDLERFRTELYDRIENAMTTNDATPGWWCATCTCLSSCPAVPTELDARFR